MEIKETIGLLEGLKTTVIYAMDRQALQTAISHLETLQRVKERRGVIRLTFGEIYDENSNCDFNYVKGWNESLDFKDDELAGKLEELTVEKITEIMVDCNSKWAEDKAQAILNAIRSHILGTGKKEE